MTDSLYYKTKNFFRYWYGVFTTAIVCNFFACIFFPVSANYIINTVFIAPFVHCFFIFIFYFVLSFLESKQRYSSPMNRNHVDYMFSSQEQIFLLKEYPQLYKTLVPNGEEIDIFAFEKFLKSGYENGEDQRLVLIRKKIKFSRFVVSYPFFVIIVSWILGIVLLISKGL